MPFRISDRRSRPTRIHKLGVIVIATLLLVTLHRLLPWNPLGREFESPLSPDYARWGPFDPIEFPGFLNSGLPGKRSCDDLKYNGTIGVQKSHHIYDNLTEIVLSLDTHPIVSDADATTNISDLKVAEIVRQKWTWMSGSSIWFPEQSVFLVVRRIVYLGAKEDLNFPKASFLRGQVFDENWKQLENHPITWNGNTFVFPLIFNIPAEYEGGEGELYGPEDPRIILEDGVKGAEPVIIFNMVHSRSDWKRAMYVFRPFSNSTTILTIRDQERQDQEKNWAPFFLSSNNLGAVSASPRPPSEVLHFIYGFKPLRVLKCHLRIGDCDLVFEQSVPADFVRQRNENGGALRGGTNLVPIPMPASYHIHPEVQAYAAFPRTNVVRYMDRIYRPEFLVMVSIKSQFHLAFVSEALDFGSAILDNNFTDDSAGKGRILIPNSISWWDAEQDVMTVTWSVDDRSNQVARFHGILSFVRNLPQFHGLLREDGPLGSAEQNLTESLSSWIGDDVRFCAVKSSIDYAFAAKDIHKNFDPSPENPI